MDDGHNPRMVTIIHLSPGSTHPAVHTFRTLLAFPSELSLEVYIGVPILRLGYGPRPQGNHPRMVTITHLSPGSTQLTVNTIHTRLAFPSELSLGVYQGPPEFVPFGPKPTWVMGLRAQTQGLEVSDLSAQQGGPSVRPLDIVPSAISAQNIL